MKKITIKHFSVIQTGKLVAMFYVFIAIVMVPIFVVASKGNIELLNYYLIMLFLYPVIGFVGGVVGAFFYNLCVRFVGGLEVFVDVVVDDWN